MFKNLLAKLSPGLGIDLGTTNSLVYLEGQELLLMSHQWWLIIKKLEKF
jgi:actin-like ATPase involved in cell morphogenesis